MKTLKVKIIKSCGEDYKVGEVYEVEELDDDRFVITHGENSSCEVNRKNCEVVRDTEPKRVFKVTMYILSDSDVSDVNEKTVTDAIIYNKSKLINSPYVIEVDKITVTELRG